MMVKHESGHQMYYDWSNLLCKRCIRRARLRQEPCPEMTGLDEEREEQQVVKKELREVERQIQNLISRMHEYESRHSDLGIHQIQDKVKRELTDSEYCILFVLFWAQFSPVRCEGNELLLGCVSGRPADLVSARGLLHAESPLRSTGIIYPHLHRGRFCSVMDVTYYLSEWAARSMSMNADFKMTFECQKIDEDMQSI